MADHSYYATGSPTKDEIGNVSPQQSTPERIRHLPDWEVPLHPPKRRRRGSDSVFSRLLRAPTNLTIPSPTFSIPESFKRHQTKLTARPKNQTRRGSTPINKKTISSPFDFVHNATGTPPPVASMSRLEKEMILGSPTGTGMHAAGPRYMPNPNAVSSHTMTTMATSPPGTPSQDPQNYQHDQESPNKRGIPRAERSLLSSTLSPTVLFPRLTNQISSTVNSLLPTSPPPNQGSHNPNTPPNPRTSRFHSPKSLGFIRSSPKNGNRARGGIRNKPLPTPRPPPHVNPMNLESGHGHGYEAHRSRGSEKLPFPMNLPPYRRKMLFFIIPVATILILALIIGLGLGLGLRPRFDDTNRLSQGGASGDGIDGGGNGNAGAGNETSSSTIPFTAPITTSAPGLAPTTSTSPTFTSITSASSMATPSAITSPIITASIPTTLPVPRPTTTPIAEPNPNPNLSPSPESNTAPDASPTKTSVEPNPVIIPPNDPNSPPNDPTTTTTTIYPGPDSSLVSIPSNSGLGIIPPPPPTSIPTLGAPKLKPTGTPIAPSPSSPTDTTVPQPQPSELPLPPPLSNNPGPFSGQLLVYNATGVGACGVAHTESELIAGIAWEVFDVAMAISGGSGSCMAAAAGGGGGGGGGGGSFRDGSGPGSGSSSGLGCENGGGGTLSGNPNENILCGLEIMVRLDRGEGNDSQGQGVIVRVVDRCTSCGPTDLGLSPGVFKALGDEQALQEGRARGVWEWVQ